MQHKSTRKNKRGKVKKDNRYYTFWGIITIAVVTGQIYVGLGYRQMSNTIIEATRTTASSPYKNIPW